MRKTIKKENDVMQLTEAETNVIKDLQTQEKTCVEKYRFYEASAHDRQLKDLFHRIGDEEHTTSFCVRIPSQRRN